MLRNTKAIIAKNRFWKERPINSSSSNELWVSDNQELVNQSRAIRHNEEQSGLWKPLSASWDRPLIVDCSCSTVFPIRGILPTKPCQKHVVFTSASEHADNSNATDRSRTEAALNKARIRFFKHEWTDCQYSMHSFKFYYYLILDAYFNSSATKKKQ